MISTFISRALARAILPLALTAAISAAAPAAEYFVAPGGNDRNPGTKAKPLATLEAARDAVRKTKRKADEGITVWISGGEYRRTKTFELDARDSGTKSAPVVYRSVPGQTVRLTGGASLPPSAFTPVKDASVLARLDPAVRGKVLQVDLKARGIANYGRMSARGFRRPYVNPGLEVFVNDTAMRLARWPNDDTIAIGKVIDGGASPRTGDYSNRGGTFTYDSERPARWKDVSDAWVSGLFNVGYADDTIRIASLDAREKRITLAGAHMYGLNSGKKWNRFFVMNLLEEVDSPGEYYLDRKTGVLYLYPPAPLGKARITVSLLDEPLVAMEGASYVTLRDLTLEDARGMGVYIERGTGNQIAGCTLRNLGLVAVSVGKGIAPDPVYRHEMPKEAGKPVSRQLGSWHEYIYSDTTFDREGGTDHGIVGCYIYGIGAGAISLGGGDRKTLTPAGNFVENCHIHDFNRWDRSYKAAVNIDGVGNAIRRNDIHDAPGSAIYLHGNDHVIELNEIHRTCTDADDMGVFYMGRDPSEQGNVIRHNFFHHNGNVAAGKTWVVYFDDGSSGGIVTGNVFYGNPDAFHNNGGHDHLIQGNLLLRNESIRVGQGKTPQQWYEWVHGPLPTARLTESVDVRKPPYATRYPKLAHVFDDAESLSVYNDIVGNVAWQCGSDFGDPRNRQRDNWLTDGEIGMVDAARMNFALKPDSPVFAKIPGFQPIPFGEIGLRRDEYRKRLPMDEPFFTTRTGALRGEETIVAAVRTPGAVIRYTLDGSVPTKSSPILNPASLPALPTTVTIRAFAPDGSASGTATQRFIRIVPEDPTRNTADGWLTGYQAAELKGVDVDGQGAISRCEGGDWAKFGPFDFGSDRFKLVEAMLAVDDAHAGQKIHLRLDAPDGPTVGTFSVRSTGSFQRYQPQTLPLSGLSGRHTLYLCFEGGAGIGNVGKFRFLEKPVKGP